MLGQRLLNAAVGMWVVPYTTWDRVPTEDWVRSPMFTPGWPVASPGNPVPLRLWKFEVPRSELKHVNSDRLTGKIFAEVDILADSGGRLKGRNSRADLVNHVVRNRRPESKQAHCGRKQGEPPIC